MRAKHFPIAGLLPLVIALSLLAAWTPAASAEPLVRSTLSGELLHEGFARPAEDGGTTLLGTTVKGDATGGLPGQWGMVLQSTFAAESSTGEVLGFFVVVTPDQGMVYGTLAGVANKDTGAHTLAVVVMGGTGEHRDCAGAGTLRGDLDAETESFSGTLTVGMTYASHSAEPPTVDHLALARLLQ